MGGGGGVCFWLTSSQTIYRCIADIRLEVLTVTCLFQVLSEVWQKTTGNEAVRVTSRSSCVFVEGRGGRSLTVITTPSLQQQVGGSGEGLNGQFVGGA